jgi:hypothetical protein
VTGPETFVPGATHADYPAPIDTGSVTVPATQQVVVTVNVAVAGSSCGQRPSRSSSCS